VVLAEIDMDVCSEVDEYVTGFRKSSSRRSSAIRRESAHLTWLYCTVQMAFQYETV